MYINNNPNTASPESRTGRFNEKLKKARRGKHILSHGNKELNETLSKLDMLKTKGNHFMRSTSGMRYDSGLSKTNDYIKLS